MVFRGFSPKASEDLEQPKQPSFKGIPVWITVILIIIAAGIISFFTLSFSSIFSQPAQLHSQIQSQPKETYKVVKVVDGDTIDLQVGNEVKRTRLLGINTPETVDPRKPVECFGKEASNFAKTLMSGKNISIEGDSSQDDYDKYGRMLRYIWLEDGTFVNEKLVREGYAYEYTFEGRSYKYQALFKAAQKEAQENKRGLWNPDICNGQK